ncbi:MAG TPA: GNAT family N-acetyltransferase [Rhodanobacteraceae bacterium]|nr:GNAT family N-acetyltransferase [Rhodanobacteraceae bacterium]
MSDGIAITRATPADLDALAPLFDGYRVFYGKPSDPALARAFLQERLSNDESVIFLARDAEGSALGFTQLYPCFSSVSARRLWILNDLFISPDARRCGVARALLEQAREHGMETGVVRLTLQTAHDNAQAQALYESLGWVRQDGMYEYALEL